VVASYVATSGVPVLTGVLFIRKRELELEIDFEGWESKAILALSNIPFVRYDEYTDTYRALPCVYWEIRDRFRRMGFRVETEVNEDLHVGDVRFRERINLRQYQRDVIDRLSRKGFRGVVVLPTGAGKSVIGMYAISRLRCRTLVVVPTIELMHQWRWKIRKSLGVLDQHIGAWGGGRRDIREITITTYQSACRRDFLLKAMDMFNLVIFDEAHHLPAETYIEIAKRLIARYRIGLTATPRRVDMRDRLLTIFVGDIIYGAGMKTLIEKGFLARYEYEKIRVSMTKEEYEEYKGLMRIYRKYVEERFPNLSGRAAFERVVKMAWKDRRAKEALEARMKAKSIAMAPKAKIEKLNEILEKHKRDKVIIFTRLKRTAHLISYLFGIPVITSDVPKSVRRRIFSMFERGRITKIVSAEALDEGVDVPDASVGIIVSGTSSERQYVQRVGRVLRPKDKPAKIYELVTAKSFDEFLSKARKGLIRRE